mmetsp:Transcript_44199/g.86448  ORF Transcript_44199/g.86448 Transcript_44199/m.86448 type:complete len:681 (-) Transcript_44199:330-2372(-)
MKRSKTANKISQAQVDTSEADLLAALNRTEHDRKTLREELIATREEKKQLKIQIEDEIQGKADDQSSWESLKTKLEEGMPAAVEDGVRAWHDKVWADFRKRENELNRQFDEDYERMEAAEKKRTAEISQNMLDQQRRHVTQKWEERLKDQEQFYTSKISSMHQAKLDCIHKIDFLTKFKTGWQSSMSENSLLSLQARVFKSFGVLVELKRTKLLLRYMLCKFWLDKRKMRNRLQDLSRSFQPLKDKIIKHPQVLSRKLYHQEDFAFWDDLLSGLDKQYQHDDRLQTKSYKVPQGRLNFNRSNIISLNRIWDSISVASATLDQLISNTQHWQSIAKQMFEENNAISNHVSKNDKRLTRSLRQTATFRNVIAKNEKVLKMIRFRTGTDTIKKQSIRSEIVSSHVDEDPEKMASDGMDGNCSSSSSSSEDETDTGPSFGQVTEFRVPEHETKQQFDSRTKILDRCGQTQSARSSPRRAATSQSHYSARPGSRTPVSRREARKGRFELTKSSLQAAFPTKNAKFNRAMSQLSHYKPQDVFAPAPPPLTTTLVATEQSRLHQSMLQSVFLPDLSLVHHAPSQPKRYTASTPQTLAFHFAHHSGVNDFPSMSAIGNRQGIISIAPTPINGFGNRSGRPATSMEFRSRKHEIGRKKSFSLEPQSDASVKFGLRSRSVASGRAPVFAT